MIPDRHSRTRRQQRRVRTNAAPALPMLDAAILTPLTPDHLDAVLALNNAHAAELSLLDATRLTQLLHQSVWAARIGDVDAFMLMLDQSADYDSPNHRWFRGRDPRFAYVDRIVRLRLSRRRDARPSWVCGRTGSGRGHRPLAFRVGRTWLAR